MFKTCFTSGYIIVVVSKDYGGAIPPNIYSKFENR